jgi:site-specific DNA-adenine methylase
MYYYKVLFSTINNFEVTGAAFFFCCKSQTQLLKSELVEKVNEYLLEFDDDIVKNKVEKIHEITKMSEQEFNECQNTSIELKRRL